MVDDGFTGIPVRVRKSGRKASPEALKQWQDLDAEKHRKKEHQAEKEFRDTRKTKRAEKKRTPAKTTRTPAKKGG